jgi:hypothetical protein
LFTPAAVLIDFCLSNAYNSATPLSLLASVLREAVNPGEKGKGLALENSSGKDTIDSVRPSDITLTNYFSSGCKDSSLLKLIKSISSMLDSD